MVAAVAVVAGRVLALAGVSSIDEGEPSFGHYAEDDSCKASERAPGPSCEVVLRFQSFELHALEVQIPDAATFDVDASGDVTWAAEADQDVLAWEHREGSHSCGLVEALA